MVDIITRMPRDDTMVDIITGMLMTSLGPNKSRIYRPAFEMRLPMASSPR